MKTWRFILFAAVLSAAWYPILLIPPLHREFLTQTGRFKDTELGGSPFYYLLCMVATGLIVGLCFRRQIVSADTRKSIFLGFTLPYLCTALFMTLITSPALLELNPNLHDWWAVMMSGVFVTLLWLPLVAPAGIAVQFVLRWAGTKRTSTSSS